MLRLCIFLIDPADSGSGTAEGQEKKACSG